MIANKKVSNTSTTMESIDKYKGKSHTYLTHYPPRNIP